MDVQRVIRVIMADKRIKIGEIAERSGINPRTLSSQLARDGLDMRLSSVGAWVDALDCDLVIRDRATGKIYEISPTTPVGEIGEVDSGAVSPQNNSKKQKPTN